MGERKLDRLFLRYRRRGDTAALGEVFDRAAPELLKLAMHLVRDPVEAEDVLQATFLAAIEGAESFDAERRLLPWLAGILARQAGLARRRARRVVEPDRLHERAEPDPLDQAEAREFSEELVVALQNLPEKYREVIWLHLADGKRPVEIARDLDRAPGTVRMQMHRGLELLRRALPPGFAAAGMGMIGQTRGLAAIRAEVLEQGARRIVPLAPGGGLVAGAAAWGALKAGLAVVGLALLAGGVWWGIRGERSREPDRSLASNAAELPREAVAGRSDVEVGETRSARPVPPALQETPGATPRTAIWLRGRVSGLAASRMGEVELSVRGIARFPWPPEVVVRGRPGVDGEFELEVSRLFEAARPQRPLEELQLEADHPACVRAQVRVPVEGENSSEYQADLALLPAGILRGRVVTASGAPAATGFVALYALVDGAPLIPALDRGPCEADGSFVLRAPAAGEHVLLALANDLRPRTERFELAPSTTLPLADLVLEEGARIEGTAYQLGMPMRAGALVSAGTTSEGSWHSLEGRRWLWTGASFERGGGIVQTDEHGRFSILGLAPGPYRVGVARPAPAGSIASQGRMLLSSAARSLVEAPAHSLELDATFATVHFQLRGEDASEPGNRRARVLWRQGERSIDFPLQGEWRCSVAVEPRASCAVRVECEGFVTRELEFDAPGPGEESTEIVRLLRDPSLARLTLRLSSGDAADAPMTQASFGFHPSGSEDPPVFLRHATGEDGVFELADLPSGAWSVSVHAGGVYRQYRELWCASRIDVQLAAGTPCEANVQLERGGRLRVSARTASGAYLPATGVLRNARGEAVEVDFVGRAPSLAASSPRQLSTLGASDVHPILRAGSYELELSSEGHRSQIIPLRIRAHECTEIDASMEPLGAQR